MPGQHRILPCKGGIPVGGHRIPCSSALRGKERIDDVKRSNSPPWRGAAGGEVGPEDWLGSAAAWLPDPPGAAPDPGRVEQEAEQQRPGRQGGSHHQQGRRQDGAGPLGGAQPGERAGIGEGGEEGG